MCSYSFLQSLKFKTTQSSGISSTSFENCCCCHLAVNRWYANVCTASASLMTIALRDTFFLTIITHHKSFSVSYFVIPPLIEWGLYCNHLVLPSVHTFVTDISASTGRNDFIFDIWLWHGYLYCVSPFQVYRTSTSCLPCDLQMNEWGYS